VVDKPVDQGGGDHGVAEDLAPLLEAAVAGDDDRAAFVAARDEREEQVGRLPFEWQVADFVDDEQVVALEPTQLRLELVAVLRGVQSRDPFLGGGEGDPVAVLAGLERKRGREVGLAGAGRVGVALLTLLIGCRNASASRMRRATCAMSSSRCSAGAPSTVRRRLSVGCLMEARARSLPAGLTFRSGSSPGGRSALSPHRPRGACCARVLRR
jgi:hypothetical protein